MNRVTDDMIKRRVARLQKEGMDVELDGAYGRWKVVSKDESRTLSPRVPNRQIWDWLEAFELGWEQHAKYMTSVAEDYKD